MAEGSETIIRPLYHQWYFISSSGQAYLPYYYENESSVTTIHTFIHTSEYKGCKLKLENAANSQILINNQIRWSISTDSAFYLHINDLQKHASGDSIKLSIYNGGTNFKNFAASIVKDEVSIPASVSPLQSTLRNQDQLRSQFLIVIIVLMILFAVFMNAFPKEYNTNYSLGSFIRPRFGDDYVSRSRIMNTVQLFLYFIHALLLSFIFLLFHYNFRPIPFVENVSTQLMIADWLILGAFIFIAILFKFFIVSLVSKLFEIKEVIGLYFTDYIKLSLLFYSFCAVSLTLVYIRWPWGLERWFAMLFIMAIAFNLLRLIFIFFRLQNRLNINFLHLFSYLCATEMITLLPGLKYFIN